MVEIYLDEVQGASGEAHVTQGASWTRVVTFTGLDASLFTAPTAELFQTVCDLCAMDTRIGPLGSPCPDISKPTFLERMIPEVIAPDAVRVRLVYRGFAELQIEFSSTLVPYPTNKDKDGNDMSVSYTFPDDYFNRQWRAKTDEAVVTINLGKPETTVTLRYTAIANESQTASEVVMSFIQTYMGKVNASTWESFPGDARTWLCESVRANSRDGGTTYELALTFHYREQTWDEYVVYLRPDTGTPPSDLEADVGKKTYRVRKEIDFPRLPGT